MIDLCLCDYAYAKLQIEHEEKIKDMNFHGMENTMIKKKRAVKKKIKTEQSFTSDSSACCSDGSHSKHGSSRIKKKRYNNHY